MIQEVAVSTISKKVLNLILDFVQLHHT